MSDSATRRATFARIVREPEEQLDLARAALSIAGSFRSRMDPEPYLNELDLMAAALADRVDLEETPAAIFAAINHYLFSELGFKGNHEAYADPRNSFLNDVLDRRLGIPITLSLVYMELGRRIGLLLDGIGYPGHFLVRYTPSGRDPIYLDPFRNGLRLDEDQLLRGIVRAGGSSTQGTYLLSSVTKRQILLRMLMNLKHSYAQAREYDQAFRTIELLLALTPWDLDERRDRGRIAVALRRYDEAISDLETYLEFRPDASDAPQVRDQLRQIRRIYTSDDRS
ncbi:MAG: SirB1 family protein [Dehalococcoidia bacterium]